MAADRDLDNARALARVLDTAIGIPGTKLRVGLDALLGLIPGAGDAVSAALSGYIVLAAARAGASRPVLLRMIGNVVFDTVVGSIPILGDLFDVAFRANSRNVALLERLAADPITVDRSSRRVGVIMVVILVLVLLGIVTLGVLLARLIWNLLASL
ncbi:MAG: DUF4112 domain-containing protein [Gemmatimonadaceae bacterium]